MNDRPDNRVEPSRMYEERAMTDNRDRYIAQSKDTKGGTVGALPPRQRAPLIDPRKVAAQLAAMCRSQLPTIVGDDHAND